MEAEGQKSLVLIPSLSAAAELIHYPYQGSGAFYIAIHGTLHGHNLLSKPN